MAIEITFFELWPWLPALAIVTYGIHLFIIRSHSRLKYAINLIYFYFLSFSIISVSIIGQDIYAKWRVSHFDLNGDGIFTSDDSFSPIRDYYTSFIIHDTSTSFWFMSAAVYAIIAVATIQIIALAIYLFRKMIRPKTQV